MTVALLAGDELGKADGAACIARAVWSQPPPGFAGAIISRPLICACAAGAIASPKARAVPSTARRENPASNVPVCACIEILPGSALTTVAVNYGKSLSGNCQPDKALKVAGIVLSRGYRRGGFSQMLASAIVSSNRRETRLPSMAHKGLQ